MAVPLDERVGGHKYKKVKASLLEAFRSQVGDER
jgi:hypothetical protein